MSVCKKILISIVCFIFMFSSCTFAVQIKDVIKNYENENAYVGIDVSKWQGNIDWKKVSDSGVKYAMIRCGYRGYSNAGTIAEDPKFHEYINGALENGLFVGVYFFSTAINENEAIEEAQFVLDICKEYDITYPIAYDFEYFGELFDSKTGNPYRTNGLTNKQINENAKAFINYIKKNSEYKTMLYGSYNYLYDTWNTKEFDNIWVAEYSKEIIKNTSNYTGKYNMWQCSNKGEVDGISTLVDINFDYTYYLFYGTKENPFIDVNKDEWYYDAIKYVKENEIILGYGNEREFFGPNDKITRGMFVTILHRLAGSPDANDNQKYFPDVNQNEYYANAINWASSVGIVNGYNEGTFGPNDLIKRQDMAIILRNYAEIVLNENINVVNEEVVNKFMDNNKIETYAKEAVIWAIENGVITGKEDLYIDPIGTATRAETASMIYKYNN